MKIVRIPEDWLVQVDGVDGDVYLNTDHIQSVEKSSSGHTCILSGASVMRVDRPIEDVVRLLFGEKKPMEQITKIRDYVACDRKHVPASVAQALDEVESMLQDAVFAAEELEKADIPGLRKRLKDAEGQIDEYEKQLAAIAEQA
jgi:hypothetical protein